MDSLKFFSSTAHVRGYTIRVASPAGMYTISYVIWSPFNSLDYFADKALLAEFRTKGDKHFNIPQHVEEKVGVQLHKRPNHPINTIKTLIHDYFNTTYATMPGGRKLDVFEDISPIVNHRQCFDSLLIPTDHPSRSPNDTYYINELRAPSLGSLIRWLTFAFLPTALFSFVRKLVLIKPNYYTNLLHFYSQGMYIAVTRMPRLQPIEPQPIHPHGPLLFSIDTSHFPVFHQMEGLRVFNKEDFSIVQATTPEAQTNHVISDMKRSLEGMVHKFVPSDLLFHYPEPLLLVGYLEA